MSEETLNFFEKIRIICGFAKFSVYQLKENDYPEKNNKSTTEEQKQKQNISSNNQDSMHFNSEKILEYNSTLFNAKTDKKNFFDVIYPEKKYSFYFNRIINIKRTRFKNRRKN